jgi:hypothetical protein
MVSEALDIGQTINIYQDPITCRQFEGRAIIRKINDPFLGPNDFYGWWCDVEFKDEPGTTYPRLVLHPLGLQHEGED